MWLRLLVLHRVIVSGERFVFQVNRSDIENVYNDDFHRLESKESVLKPRFLDGAIHFRIEVSEQEKYAKRIQSEYITCNGFDILGLEADA